jgi:hypothetical protein
MRNDPSLCFLARCGPPDANAIAREMNDDLDTEKYVVKSSIYSIKLYCKLTVAPFDSIRNAS